MAHVALYVVFTVGVLVLLALGVALVAWIAWRWRVFTELYWAVLQWRLEGRPTQQELQGFKAWRVAQEEQTP